MPLKVAPKKQATEDPRHIQAVQNYETGLRALQEHKFEKAKGHLQKVLSGPNKALVDRAQVHILACDKHLETFALQFKTTEEHYDYAVSLINVGDYVTAREHLDKLSEAESEGGVCSLRSGRAALPRPVTLKNRSRRSMRRFSIKPALRFQARNDTDFQNLAEDPRFTELLYPDPGGRIGTAGRRSERLLALAAIRRYASPVAHQLIPYRQGWPRTARGRNRRRHWSLHAAEGAEALRHVARRWPLPVSPPFANCAAWSR